MAMAVPHLNALDEPVLLVEGLTKHFTVRGRARSRAESVVRAVNGVDLVLAPRETLALVGESGCGKSTTGRLIVRLLEPTEGRIVFRGEDITHHRRRQLRDIRRELQIVFQDPFASLNPRLPVREILAEPLRIHGAFDRRQGPRRVQQLLDLVGLAREHADRFPHEFSGGQRQRIAIARALALNPRLIVLDEPVSALDVSVQAQIINLLEELQEELDLTYLFISHDLSVVRHIADRVAVMYLGQIVELGESNDVFEQASHPYTQALLSAAPVADPRAKGRRERIRLVGELETAAAGEQAQCPFRPRCWRAFDRCAIETPELTCDYGSRHPAACFRPVAFSEPRAGGEERPSS